MKKFLMIMLLLGFLSSDALSAMSTINWLPSTLAKKIEDQNCDVPYRISWANNIDLKAQGMIVGQFAAPGQYDLALMCNDKIFILWGGEHTCSDEIENPGESLGIPDDEEVFRYIKRTENKEWPKHLAHDSLGSYNFGKSSFYQYCLNGEWLLLNGAD